MNVAPRSVRARAFDAWAGDYERFRPGYPAALFDLVSTRLDLPPGPTVVDLGAGTGKIARAVAARGWRATAVDPGGTMLAVLRDRASAEGVAIDVVQAAAEQTGLPDATYDAALVGEAFHWFDAPAALAEMARIVRPGGGIALFWNMIDETRSSLVAGERQLVARYGIDGSDVRQPGPQPETRAAIAAVGAFEEPAFFQIPHVVAMTGDEYVGLAHTKSHLRTAPDEIQSLYGRAFADMLVRRGIGPSDRLEVPYIVDCWIAKRSRS